MRGLAHGTVVETKIGDGSDDDRLAEGVRKAVRAVLSHACPAGHGGIDEVGRCDICECWWSAGTPRGDERWMGDVVLRQSWIGPIR